MADRVIVYPGSIPLETDILSTNKFSMIGLAKLAAAIMGNNTYFNGLACAPTSPASLSVNIAPGEIYSLQNVDGTAYSSISADTTHSILKQGVLIDAVALTMAAPITSGMSVNYLVQVAYQDTDSNAVALPYYNSANPTQAWSGPNNSGATQNTVRSGVCAVALKTGVTATTGTQVTPAADTGYVGAYVITVAYGQSTITTANISYATNAPFLPSNGIVAGIQKGTLLYAADTGSANVYAAAYFPAITALTDGIKVVFKAKTANTGTCTFSPNGLTAYPIYSHANQALQGGEIVANGLIEVEWNSTLTAWVLCGNSGGATPVLAATKTNHAVNLGQLNASPGRLLNVQVFTSSGTYTPTPGTTSVIVECQAAGGAGGAAAVTGVGAVSMGSGGTAGTYGKGRYTSGFTGGIPVVVGTGGVGTTTASTAGGNSSFGSLLSCIGGGPGARRGPTAPPFSVTGAPGGSVATGANIISSSGGPGGSSFAVSTSVVVPGVGGSSTLGGGGALNGIGSNGIAGPSAGSGGSGAANTENSAAALSGGNGGDGLVVVWEYA